MIKKATGCFPDESYGASSWVRFSRFPVVEGRILGASVLKRILGAVML